jgi:hypothetical protein
MDWSSHIAIAAAAASRPAFVIFVDDFTRMFISRVVRHHLKNLIKKRERELLHQERFQR